MDKSKTKKAKKETKIKVREFLTVYKCTGCDSRVYRQTFCKVGQLSMLEGLEQPHISHMRSESNFYCGTFEPYEIYELKKRR